ncbi:MAG: glyoxalase/bleomycin resistance/dioxygenase family protein [Gemmatimonadetes bacterium]|jgi:catechol 2,3-dioxygenase-like lactoylglutathione lyase family enzyme|nr:glyoxalase/bleomycin resistance/dioxygenase family protein [Gemmatimonadota bacterium]MBT6149133.1 glyoxalase/bleomycin resistance/dioxygenase family protein [Gemmatimonadota bacterium]MBT7863990.1 glyoxalase/bleomycin resistance/dioxygenase family protein [Gemmatimonadota bacterium]
MLHAIKELTYTILLVDDMESMKVFYRELFPFEIRGESDTGLSFNPGNTLFSLRQRTRDYDGKGPRLDAPGVQLAFLVEPHQVDECYQILLERGVEIAEPPTDQPRRHRTLYFYDPEHNLLEIYAEI